MTELQKITTEVRPTSFENSKTESNEVKYNDCLQSLQQLLKANSEQQRVFDEGIFTEKNKVNTYSKILIDVISYVLDQDDTKIDNPNELVIHKQNKKFIKESLILLLNSLKHYSIDDKKVKLMLTGKLIQSLYESKN
jgi:hypothetical protein